MSGKLTSKAQAWKFSALMSAFERRADLAASLAQCQHLAGLSAGDLPTGMQIVGRRFDDVGVLKVGTTLESARRWSGCHPTI